MWKYVDDFRNPKIIANGRFAKEIDTTIDHAKDAHYF